MFIKIAFQKFNYNEQIDYIIKAKMEIIKWLSVNQLVYKIQIMSKCAPHKKIPKQSTILPQKKQNHFKTIEAPQSSNITLMKWNSFLQSFHHLKQIYTINASISLIATHLKQKKQQFTIKDVPYITSEQILEDDNEARTSNKCSEKQPNQNQEQSEDTMKQSEFDDEDSKHDARILQSIEISNDCMMQSQNTGKILKKKEKINVQKQNKENMWEENENFTEDQQNEEEFYDGQSEGTCKNLGSTKNSKFYNIVNSKVETLEEDYICEQLKRTAHFTNEHNTQNINYQNNLHSKKLMVLRKIQQEKVKVSKDRKNRIHADKQFLDQLLWK